MKAQRLSVWPLIGLVLFVPPAWAAGSAEEPQRLLLALAVILLGARLSGEIAFRLGQPPVLGELLFGILLGNLQHAGVAQAKELFSMPSLALLAELGAVILLFEVGLESTVRDMLQVGLSSFLVATIGVVMPMALGWLVGVLLMPERGPYVHAFLGATLCATSVGITARVLKDLGRAQSQEARIIIGAAVIDDVLGLVVLAIVSGAIRAADGGGSLTAGDIAWIAGKAALFLTASLVVGGWVAPRLFSAASRIRSEGTALVISLGFCFGLAHLASRVGLAAIVGAYAAGLVLEPIHFRKFEERGEKQLEELLQPVAAFLVPVFFVVMGLHVDLAAFARPDVLGVALALTVAAVAGKQVCALGVLGGGLDRLSVGLGMIPRGEVGLIFAGVGLSLTVAGRRIIDEGLYAAVVVMVVLTTLMTPPLLKWSLARPAPPTSPPGAGEPQGTA